MNSKHILCIPLILSLFIAIFNCSVLPAQVTVAIISTNDIHGRAFPVPQVRADNGEEYAEGGLSVMASMIRTVREQYRGRSIYLDAGDQLQGGIQSKLSRGEIVLDFFDRTNLDASVIGNHEFDFGEDFLKQYLMSKKHPTLGANIKFPADNIPNLFPSKLFPLPLYNITIGIIGLTTVEVLSTSLGFINGEYGGYRVLDYQNVVQQQARNLRQRGADAVLIMGHVGNECSFNDTYGYWEEMTEQESCKFDQISKLIDNLPHGTINGVIQGHRHTFSHHFYQGVPIMGSNIGGKHFNIMYLRFQGKKVIQSKIEGPIPVCQKIFKARKSCKWMDVDELFSAGDLMKWNFHGRQVQKDQVLQNLYKYKYFPMIKEYLVPLCNSKIHLNKTKNEQSALMNLFLYSLHDSLPSLDIIIINPGSLRSQWSPGVILLQNLYDMSPFDNQIIRVDLTGQVLLQILKIIQSGEKGFYGVYGVRQVVGINSVGKKRLISVKLFNGEDINPLHIYKIGMSEFLFAGGDDFRQVVSRGFFKGHQITKLGELRSFVQKKLKKIKTIQKKDWLNQKQPMLTIVQQ